MTRKTGNLTQRLKTTAAAAPIDQAAASSSSEKTTTAAAAPIDQAAVDQAVKEGMAIPVDAGVALQLEAAAAASVLNEPPVRDEDLNPLPEAAEEEFALEPGQFILTFLSHLEDGTVGPISLTFADIGETIGYLKNARAEAAVQAQIEEDAAAGHSYTLDQMHHVAAFQAAEEEHQARMLEEQQR